MGGLHRDLEGPFSFGGQLVSPVQEAGGYTSFW